MRKTMTTGVLVVGAGHAGAAVAAQLRRAGYAAPITLVNDEARLPYERPPLSKLCLLDPSQAEAPLLRPRDFWADAGIDLASDVKVVALNPAERKANLSDGRSVAFDWCVLATGGRARALACPGADLPGCHVLRNHADMERLRAHLATAQDIVVIGGGYVGLEVAASARALGKSVTVIEAQQRVLSRVTSAPVSRFFESVHRRQGVKFHLGRAVSALAGQDRIEAVVLDDGTEVAADAVIVGIGIDAETALAEAAGIACHGGVVVDAHFRSSAPRVLAIGDCARHPNDFAGGMWRLESVQHAQDSAAVAALTIMGETRVYQDVPTFWSEQYDIRLQSAGIARDADDFVVRGDLDLGPFSIVYLREGRMIAVDCVNNAREFMAARKLIGTRASLDRTLVGDTSVSLRAFA
jgi:3-phenylpropionate/trans-cinnamate dioxygenase ferredoxin reductase subunit